MLRRPARILVAAATAAAALLVPAASTAAAHPTQGAVAADYRNPLALTLPGGGQALNCADPFVARDDRGTAVRWYAYCTSDVLTAGGPMHLLPFYASTDLVHWSYLGDAAAATPSWVGGGSMWAPDLVHRNGRWYLYYTASDTATATAPTGGGSAIGVLTGPGPAGPWTDAGQPVVPPQANPYSPSAQRWVFDPEVVRAGDRSYLYYGSYAGGISVRQLADDGLTTVPGTERQVTIDNRYEGSFVVRHGGWWYLMGSATNCCNGPLTGYSVFAGRARSPLGPFVDRDGVSLLANRVGGTPVLAQNGNRWVGAGHNAVVTDYAGQQWIFYHAADRTHPYVPGQVGYTARTLLLDPLDWRDGWPTVRGGAGPSDRPVPGPAAQPGERTAYRPAFVRDPQPGAPIAALSDEFTGTALSSRWSWIRPPAADSYRVADGALTVDTQNADLQPQNPTALASVLTEPAPAGDYVVQTRVRVSVPDDASVHNYVQGGLVVYADDGNYVKLAVSSIFDTRQTEFGRHVSPTPAGYPVYGNGVGGAVGDWTWLRIVRRTGPGDDRYTAFTSVDGRRWDRTITWTLPARADLRIGLVSMGGSGFRTTFDYVRVSRPTPAAG